MKVFDVLRHYDAADLDVYQFRMLIHIWRVGECWETLRTTAESCQMSLGKASAVRKWLLENKWIEEITARNGQPAVKACSRHERDVHHTNTTVHDMNEDVHDMNEDVHDMNEDVHDMNEDVHDMNEDVHDMNAFLLNKQNEVTAKLSKQNKDSVHHMNGKLNHPQWQLLEPLDTAAFEAAWIDWYKHRLEKGQPLTQTAGDYELERLVKMGHDRAVQAIRYSIRRGWKSIHEKQNDKQTQEREGWFPI